MINLVVALLVEARPLIKRFNLAENSNARGFRLFDGEDMRLVVTGVGKTAAAAGTAYLGGLYRSTLNEAWLNIGIAGHASIDIGAAVHALRITDDATGRNWYPPQIVLMPGSGQTIVTKDQPETEYPKELVYDMESSSFYAAALHFSVRELVQCFKIISDNRLSSTSNLTRKKVRDLVTAQIENIAEAVSELSGLAEDLAGTLPNLVDFDHFVERWHFTVAQEHELRSLLQQWAARAPEVRVWDEEINRCPSARSLLAELKERFDRLPFRLTARDG